MFRYITLLLFILFYPLCTAFGQALLQQADREFESLAYLKAANLYEQTLKGAGLTTGQTLSVKAKLGYSYRQLKDTNNAERAFGDIVHSYSSLPREYYPCYLYYAQALASNGKYKEAQEVYGKYAALEEADNRGKSFSNLAINAEAMTRNTSSYRVDLLDINSSEAEFSPIYFKEGMVFVTGRKKTMSIRRVFNWNETPFLDLYYLDDLNELRKRPSSSLSSSINSRILQRRKKRGILGRDAYTAVTANDTRTVGFYAGSSYNTSPGYAESPRIESERFGKNINTKYHEGPATFYKDGNRVIFTRNNYNNGKYRESKDGINKLKLYTAESKWGSWTKVQELPFNSDEYSTGHPALNADNTILYFVSDKPGGLGGTDIYVSEFRNGTWSEPKNMGPEVNTKGNEMFPFVDNQGSLYFASDGWPGLGDLDLFVAVMETPYKAKKSLNLGTPINSSKDDFGIITDGERSKGYFSSNRRNGGSDDDIFSFLREGPLYACRDLTVSVFDAITRKPLSKALVQVVNKRGGDARQLRTDSTGNLVLCLEAENEFTFVANHQGYGSNTLGFAVNAYDDIRSTRIEIPLVRDLVSRPAGPIVMMKGKVLSHKNKPLADVLVSRRDDLDGVVQETETGPDGTYTFDAVTGRNYTMDAVYGEYGTFGKKVLNFSPDQTTEINIMMFEKGDVVQVDNIYYDLDKWGLRAEAKLELDKLVSAMKKYPEMKIELCSHTDNRASALYNKALSQRRARTAKLYLTSKGIASQRIDARGYGESRPVNHCKDGVDCTDQEYQQNRRTEIKILDLQ
ncbi:carboxypeptidase regulatory-like domain-containing protein [Telluribacter humicola]|uniref:carboxypeptidase regulatory-like domain-containing protein n=1 Tax=Telluribacter humicola TaxID=1720261 RepID=UPI001A976315|nr:carboxypeptidase regulatory-like domain-containing protein [Telluribacter humicola]